MANTVLGKMPATVGRIPTVPLLLALAIGGVLVVGGVLGPLAPGVPGSYLQIPGGCEGVTVLAVSHPSFIGANVESLVSLNWILAFASGGAECFQWGQSEVDLSAGTGGQVKNGLTFSATEYREHISYDISPDGGEIWTLNWWPADREVTQDLAIGKATGVWDYQTVGDYWIWVKTGAPLPPCAPGPNGETADAEVIVERAFPFIGFGGLGQAFKLACVKKVQEGATARLVGPGKRHEALFSVSNGLETVSQRIGVDEGSRNALFPLKSGAATLKMVSISSNPSALDPTAAGLRGFFDLRGGRWKVVSQGALDNYNNRFTPVWATIEGANILQKGSSVPDAGSNIFSRMQDVNTALQFPESKVVTAPGFTETFSGGKTGGKLTYTGPRTFYVTEYQLSVSAAWVGVFLPSGKPVIQSLSPLDLGIQTTGTVTASVLNSAPVTAAFNFAASCSPATVAAINPPTLERFGANQARSVQVTFSKGTTTEAVSATCTVRVCDSESPSVCDEEVTTVKASATGACVPGTQVPTASGVQECGADGRYRTILSCPLGVEPAAEPGKYQCRTTGPGASPTPQIPIATEPPACDPLVEFCPTGGGGGGGIPWTLVAVAAVAISGIAAVAFVLSRRGGPGMPPGALR